MKQYPGMNIPALARTRAPLWGFDETGEPNALTESAKVWWVYGIDGGIGVDTNHGQTPQSPFLTLTKALSMCVDSQQDYIVVMDYWQPTGETWPINVDVDNVHIIGADGAGTQMPIITPTGDTEGVLIAANRVEIANLAINGGATHGCIQNDATAGAARWGLLVRDCWFGVLGSAQDGIRNVTPGDNVYLTVERCTFGTGLTRDGIRIEHNATRGMIGSPWGDGNLFDQVAGIGVNVVGVNPAQLGIFNNTFVVAANTAGGAVTLIATSTLFKIFGNVANFGDTDMAANPYVDAAAAGTNHWGMNYQGITLVQPA